MREEAARNAKSQTVGNLYDLYCLEYLLRNFSRSAVDASILVLCYSILVGLVVLG